MKEIKKQHIPDQIMQGIPGDSHDADNFQHKGSRGQQ